MVKMSGYVTTFKVKDKISKLMSLCKDDEDLLQKYKAVWSNNEDLKKLNTLPVYGDRYIKTKIRTYDDKIYANFRSLNVPEDDIECESFTVISIDSLLVYKNHYYHRVYLDNCAYNFVNK